MSKIISIIALIAVIGIGAYVLGQNSNSPSLSVEGLEELQEGLAGDEESEEAADLTTEEPEEEIYNEQAILQYGQCPGFIVDSPAAGDSVTFPLTITGTIHPASNPGPWVVFEGEAGTVRVMDTNGGVRSDVAILSLDVPWMNSDPKPFSVTIPELTSTPYTNNVALVFRDNNVAGPDEGQTHQCVLSIGVDAF